MFALLPARRNRGIKSHEKCRNCTQTGWVQISVGIYYGCRRLLRRHGQCLALSNAGFPLRRSDLPDSLFYFCLHHLPVRHDGRIFSWPLGRFRSIRRFWKSHGKRRKIEKSRPVAGRYPGHRLTLPCHWLFRNHGLGILLRQDGHHRRADCHGPEYGCHRRRF